MRLTESQEKAITSGKHLSVTANAGSGKTTVLIEKYIKILEEFVDGKKAESMEDISDIVESVVVITFTEKAASELRERATQAIEQRIEEAKEKNDWIKLRKLEELRDAMPSAVIGTIHSFCARMLREFAVTAQVDANFAILEGAEKDRTIDIIIEDKLRGFLKRGDEKAERLFKIIEKMKIGNFYKFMKKLVLSRELVEKIKRDIYSVGDSNKVVKMWHEKIFDYVFRVFKESEIENGLRSLAGHLFAGDVEFYGLVNRFERAMKERDVATAYRVFCDASEMIFKKDGKLREKIANLISEKIPEIQRTIFKIVYLMQRIYNDIKGLSLDEFDNFTSQHLQYVDDTKLVLSLYDEINEEYEIFKLENGYLDFEDLQLRASKLLENEEVREELSRRFRYIMIDEYQDTNYLQYEIVKKLIKDFSGSVRLFVVGDDKQSIYGFRGSDVEVFDKTRREICGIEDGEEIYLSESFRLLRGIAGFVNSVFEKIMGERISIHEVAYSPIVVGREDDDDGKVELLLVKKDKESKEDYKIVEARFIARRILDLLGDESAYIYKNGERKKIEPGDIAVLIRNRNILKQVESAFVEVGVPYIVSSGIGFYQTQEIYDFINYLEFIVNTNDDVALVGILRSPFFGISDVEIFRISVYGKGISFWDKVCDYVNRVEEPKPSERLKRAVKILEEDLKVANRMSIPSLIQRIIVNTMYSGSVLPMRRGEQIIANVQKLIDVARDFEARGFNNLYDFVEQLRFLSSEHLREGQASVQSGIDAVQIMTIHSAKGLEFPVVVLPFLGEEFKKNNRERFNIDIDYGIGLGIEYHENESEQGLPINFVHSLIKQHKAIAEEKRVLYVGMTRARDMLILSGAYDDNSRDTYLGWIFDALDVWDKVDYIPSIEIKSKLKFKDRTERDFTFKVKIYRHNRDFIEPIEFSLRRSDVVKIDEEKIFIKPLESRPYGEFFTATQLQTFSLCPMKFYLKFRLGLPEPKREVVFEEEFEDVAAPIYEDDSRDEIVGTVKGRIVHEVLERLRSEIDDHGLGELISSVIYRNGISNEKKFNILKEYVFYEIKRVLNSDFGRRIFSSEEFYVEYGLSTKFGDGYIIGKIDRLYKVDGEWEIIDFKTDDIELEEIEKRKSEYEVQLSVYAYLLSKIYPEQKSFRSYILFTKFPDLPVEVIHTSETLKKFETELEKMVSQIKRMDLDTTFTISSEFKEHCRVCGYFKDGKCIGEKI